MLACHVTIIHELKGPSNTITCAEASSHLAIGEAFRTIQRGDADLAICGGAESKVNHMGLIRQTLLKRLTEQHNDSPATGASAIRPKTRPAARLPKAVDCSFWKSLSTRGARGENLCGAVRIWASQDAYRITDPSPTGQSYGRAIGNALKEASIAADQIGCFIPHGLGIPSHDRAELAGLRNALGAAAGKDSVRADQAQTGNLAAGCGVDAAAAVLALHHNTVPPAINTRKSIDGVRLTPPSNRAAAHREHQRLERL